MLKIVFCAVIVAQPLQYAFISLVGEPYPALFMPGFGNPRLSESGAYTGASVDLVVEFADGSTAEASTRELIEPIPSSQMNQMMRSVFRSERGGADADESGFGQFLRSYVLRAHDNRGDAAAARFGDAATRAWLASRLEQMFPGREPVAAEFRSMSDRFVVEDSEVTRTRDVEGVLRVELDRAG